MTKHQPQNKSHSTTSTLHYSLVEADGRGLTTGAAPVALAAGTHASLQAHTPVMAPDGIEDGVQGRGRG